MNIAYLANYQGEDLIRQRRLLRNRALAGSQKIATLSQLLVQAGCRVKVFSLGAVAERTGRFHRGFWSRPSQAGEVSVLYLADWDVLIAGRIVGTIGMIWALLKEQRRDQIDVVFLYNCGLPEAIAACVLAKVARVPVVLEYEDDVNQGADGRRSWRQYCHTVGLLAVQRAVRGVVAVSQQLLSQVNQSNGYVLPGVLSVDLGSIRDAGDLEDGGLRFLYAGSIQASKGVLELCEAWIIARLPGCELHIAGEGPLLAEARAAFLGEPTIHFHGFVTRERLLDLFSSAHVLVNPHRNAVETGSIFPFKMIEYLGTGRPVISTQMAALDGVIGSAVLYTESDLPAHMAAALREMKRDYPSWSSKAGISKLEAWRLYGPDAVRSALLTVFGRAVMKEPGKAAASVIR
jgi:glycosyltransferase involved in cell wall biosynthesis